MRRTRFMLSADPVIHKNSATICIYDQSYFFTSSICAVCDLNTNSYCVDVHVNNDK